MQGIQVSHARFFNGQHKYGKRGEHDPPLATARVATLRGYVGLLAATLGRKRALSMLRLYATTERVK